MKPSTQKKLAELLDFSKTHHLAEVVWQEEDTKISFRRAPVAPAASIAAPSANGHCTPADEKSNDVFITSPIVGTFRRSISKTRPPLVIEGNHIKPGDRLGIVECMKIPTDVVSFCAGKIEKVLVDDGHVVEYGQPLFLLSQSDESQDAASEG